MNAGIFAVITVISGDDEFAALRRRTIAVSCYHAVGAPAACLFFFPTSLFGIPFTGGFFGKFYSFSAAVGGQPAPLLALIGLLNSVTRCGHGLRLASGIGPAPADAQSKLGSNPSAPRVGIAVASAALLFAVAATPSPWASYLARFSVRC